MFREDNDDPEFVDTSCVGCDIILPVNDLSLCDDCYAKLERDLIRSRDWDYSGMVFGVSPEKYEALREQVIREYGAGYELIAPPELLTKKRKNKRSNSRTTQHKREIAEKAIRAYTTEDVLQAARDFLKGCDEEWVNFSRLSQYLYERFFKLKPKYLGQPGKQYTTLLKFLTDYPNDFELRPAKDKKGLYWIRRS